MSWRDWGGSVAQVLDEAQNSEISQLVAHVLIRKCLFLEISSGMSWLAALVLDLEPSLLMSRAE